MKRVFLPGRGPVLPWKERGGRNLRAIPHPRHARDGSAPAVARRRIDRALPAHGDAGQQRVEQPLSHEDAEAGRQPLLAQAASRIAPKLADFGVHLLGERIEWLLKEMWVNFLDTGGRQAMHNHANSFVSGVVYLTPSHPGSQTVFMKSPGGTDFMFRNDHPGTTPGEHSADKWISPAPQPGDMILFPSYLLHAVPPNQGELRITLSFNTLPSQLNSWGYVVKFT
jgi:uncharacterized protein (TIGR02466 family)